MDIDTDGDGLRDLFEMTPRSIWVDINGDGVMEEVTGVTSDPLLSDSEGDGLSDGEEDSIGTHPRRTDTDLDGRSDLSEVTAGTTLPQAYESPSATQASAPASPAVPRMPASPFEPPLPLWNAQTSSDNNCTWNDADCDGLTDQQEGTLGSNPLVWDTDRDGLGDGAEVFRWRSNPRDPDSDRDGIPDGYDSRPMREDQHPVVGTISSDDYRKEVQLTIYDQSNVVFVAEEAGFYDIVDGYRCDEGFKMVARWITPVQGSLAGPHGGTLYPTEFIVEFVREESGSHHTSGNICGSNFVAVLPFRDAEGNTIQVETTARANRECHVDPLRIVSLGLEVAGGPMVFATTQKAKKAVYMVETARFGFKTATNPDAFHMVKYTVGTYKLHSDSTSSRVLSNALKYLGRVHGAIGIVTGDYVACNDSTGTDEFHIILEDESNVIQDVQGRTVLVDSGFANRRAHAREGELGDGIRGHGQDRAQHDGPDYAAWYRQTLQNPVHHYSVAGRFHVYCPADRSGGYVVTSEPYPEMNRVMFITAYPAIMEDKPLPLIVRQCPSPAPVLP